eukprot:6734488-Lingulodinium_polyedra.AAC.1
MAARRPVVDLFLVIEGRHTDGAQALLSKGGGVGPPGLPGSERGCSRAARRTVDSQALWRPGLPLAH